MEIKRDGYLRQLISYRFDGLVKVITGIRRCGKSYLLKNLYREYLLANGVKSDQIIMIELDLAKDIRFHNPLELSSYVREIVENRKEECYLFVDEIQMSDRELNKKLGAQAKEFVSAAFAPETLIKEWIQLLHEVGEGREAQYRPPVNFFLKQNKWLRLVNRQVHKVTGSQMSLMEWKAKVLSHKE